MKNWRLWFGVTGVGILLVVALFGPKLAPYPENYSKMIQFFQTSHGKVMRSPPFPPSSAHWFGTNSLGSDILSLMLYGAKYTILTSILVAAIRVIFGSITGFLSGIFLKGRQSGKGVFAVLGSLPAFLIVYFVMKGITINTPLTPWEHTFIEGSLLVIVGTPGVFGVVLAKTSEIKKNLYIEAAASLGGGPFHLLRKHIFPHMKGNLMILFVNEIIASISLIGQLGIFRIFLGGTVFKPHAMIIPYRSKTHEWAGMVGQFRDFLFNMQWVVIFPICAIIFAILSFYLLSSGLEKRQRNTQHKVPYI